MKKTRIISLFIALIMMFSPVASAYQDGYEFDMFQRLSSYAANLYIDENVTTDYLMDEAMKKVMAEKPELLDALVKAAFSSLDPYSEYYTREEYELFNKNINHIVYGIGVVIQKMGEYVTVMSVVDGGGADAAGVMPEDKISKVNGVDVKGASVDKVQNLVVGEIDTEVTITFLRGDKEFECTIKRGEVTGTTVSGTILEGKIGYIEIINFAAKTYEEFYKILTQFDAAGVENIIIDLRGNPGGYLDTAISIARLLVPSGVICSTVYRNEEENEVFYSQLKETKYNLAVLIDENTGSAAEVLASAIKDSEAGILIGETTYGKGVIQQMYQMFDGSAFKITTGKYYTRNGQDINGVGVEPNEGVYNTIRRIDVTRYQTFDYKTTHSVGESSKNVYAAKERLRMMGLYQGSLDEYFDTELEKVLRTLQEKAGLNPSGKLDVFTQVHIENTFYKLEEVVDNQFYYAYEYLGGNKDDLFKKTAE